MPNNGLVNQTEVAWQSRTSPAFGFPDYVLFNEWDDTPRYAMWISSETSSTIYNVPLFTAAFTVPVPTVFVQGVWSVSFSPDIFGLNSLYVQGMNCTRQSTGSATPCMVRYLSGISGVAFGQLFPQNFTDLEHLDFPNATQDDGSLTLRIQEADLDDFALYVVVQSVDSPILTTYLTRWAQDMSAYHGSANLSQYINSSDTEIFFDSVYCRLYLREVTTVHYLQLNCEPVGSIFGLLNSTELFLFFDVATFVVDPTYPRSAGILSLDVQNLGNPYLLILFYTALGEPVYQTVHYTADGTLLSSRSSQFSYPFEADEDTATTLRAAALYSSPWGQMATTDSVHLLLRSCTNDQPPCGPCEPIVSSCVNSECRCSFPYFVGNPPSCIDVNECATNDGGCDVAHVCLNYFGGFECTTGGAEMTSWGTLGLVSSLSPSVSVIGDWIGMLALAVQSFNLSINGAYNVSFSTQRCFTCFDDYRWGEMGIYPAPDDRDFIVNFHTSNPSFPSPIVSMAYNLFVGTRIYIGTYCNPSPQGNCFAELDTQTGAILNFCDVNAIFGLGPGTTVWVVDIQHDLEGTVWFLVNFNFIASVNPTTADMQLTRIPDDISRCNDPVIYSTSSLAPGLFTGGCIDGALVNTMVNVDNYHSCAARPAVNFYTIAAAPNISAAFYGAPLNIYEFSSGEAVTCPCSNPYYAGPPRPNLFYGATANYFTNDSSSFVTLQNSTVNLLQQIIYDGVLHGNLVLNTTLSRGMPATQNYVRDHAYYRIVEDDNRNVIAAAYALQKMSQLPDFVTLGNDRAWIDAAMMYMFPNQSQACHTDDHGDCGTRTCVQTTSNRARCDACTQFDETENTTTWESILLHSPTFRPTTLFSNPFVTLATNLSTLSLWAGHRNTSVVYQFDVDNGTIQAIVQTRLPHGVAYMAQSIDTYTTTLYAVSPYFNWTAARLDLHNPAVVSSTLIATNESVAEQNATGLNCDQIFYPTEELYQVKGVTITNVRVVTIVLQGDTTGHQVMIKLNPDLTCIAAQTINDYVGNTTLHSVSFAYDYHTWYFQTNQTFPVYSGLLGGMDYVSQFWAQVIPDQPAVASLNSADQTVYTPYSILTTTSHGATAVTTAYAYTDDNALNYPVSFYQSILLNRHNQLMGRVLLFTTVERGQVVSQDEPTFSHWSSFGDLFTVLEPSFTLLRSPCRSRG
jgi:hypothetical protein